MQTSLEKLNELMESNFNFKRYRDELRSVFHSRKTAVIPYLGIILRDITFIEEGNPDYLEDDAVNFEKLEMLGDVILQEVVHFQQRELSYPDIPEIQIKLLKPVVLADELLYNLSLHIEPKEKDS